MKKTSSLSFLLFLLFVGLTLLETSCDNAKTPEVLCAIVGCHVNGSGTPGVFVGYDGMLPYLNTDANGIKDWVIDRKGMPLGFSLSDTDFELVRCWVEGGYPEN